MKLKNNKHFFKGTALAFAGILPLAFVPMGTVLSSAADAVSDKTIYLLSAGDGKAEAGSEYTIRTAYVGKDQMIPIGLTEADAYNSYEGVTESSVTVTYASTGQEIEIEKDGDANVKSEIDTFKSNKDATKLTYGSFDVEYIGTYTITYSITIGGKVYSMDFDVESTRTEASMSFEDNDEAILPTVYDVAYDKAKDANGNYKAVTLPLPEIYDKNEEKVDVQYFSESEASSISGEVLNYVVVDVIGPGAKSVGLDHDKAKNVLSINGANFDPSSQGYIAKDGSEFTILYKFYSKEKATNKAQFVTSEKKTFSVRNGYYKNYELKASVGAIDTYVTGVEKELPKVTGSVNFENEAKTESTEAANVHYTVTAKYLDGSTWVDAPAGTIKDGKFKAPKNGEYRLSFEAEDFYGNTAKPNDITIKVSDTEAPKVFIYDASDENNYVDGTVSKDDGGVKVPGTIKKDDSGKNTYLNADYKLKYKTKNTNIVVYAIGGTDNYVETSKLTYTRSLRNTDSATVEIKEYNEYNLIINYNKSALEESDLLGRALSGKSDDEANTWLIEHNFLKVLIPRQLFGDGITDEIRALKETLSQKGIIVDNKNQNFDSDENMSKFKSELKKLGYAYINSTHTITGDSSGVSYTVRYSANDGVKTTQLDPMTMNIYNGELSVSGEPTIDFNENFAESYTTDEVISFSEPQISDENDVRLYKKISYQYYKDGETAVGSEKVFEDGNYSINLKEDIKALSETPTSVKITVYAENDYNGSSKVEKVIKIADIADSVVPTIVKDDTSWADGTHTAELKQYDEVTLPTIVYQDDYVAIMNAKIEVYHLDAEGAREREITAYNSEKSYNPMDSKFTFSGGQAILSLAGDYEIVVTVSDPAKNFISTYYFFSVTSTEKEFFHLNAPANINGDGKATLGQKFSVEIPSISYNLVGENKHIFGLSENNTAKFYSINWLSGPSVPKTVGNPTSFIIDKTGEYKMKYVAQFAVYDGSDGTLKADDKGVYVESDGKKYYAMLTDTAIREAHSEIKGLYLYSGDDITFKTESGEAYSSLESVKSKYTRYEFESDELSLNVTAESNSKEYTINFGTHGGYADLLPVGGQISIFSVGGDKDIDKTKSTITVSYDGPTRTTREYTLQDFDQAYNETKKDNEKLKYDEYGNILHSIAGNGTYTISYKIVDKYGREYAPIAGQSSSYEIHVGDWQRPIVMFASDFIKDEIALNENDGYFVVDVSKIILTDNGFGAGDTEKDKETREALLKTMTIKLTRKDESGSWVEVKNIEEENNVPDENGVKPHLYKYKLEFVGEYKFTVTVKDEVLFENNPVAEKPFTVVASGKKAGISTSTIGIILIVISALILAGVIAYFVISKILASKKAKLNNKSTKKPAKKSKK